MPPVGTTVTLQVDTPVGSVGIVGVLVEVGSTSWSVRRRDGSVRQVERSSIRAWRVVPPGRSARIGVIELEQIAAMGWRALEREPLGSWLLRAGGGFTGRANSALAIGDPGVSSLEVAVDRVQDWYAARGLPTRLQLPDRAASPDLVTVLDRRRWGVSPLVHVMTAELGHVLRAVPTGTDLEVRLDEEPDADWLGCYRQDGTTPRSAARDILINHPAVIFASLRSDGRCVAIARGAVDGRWAGVHAVEVASTRRGQGLGALVTAAAMRWCGQRGARLAYLQVSADNGPAVRLYERLNFSVHHNYVYREGPPAATVGTVER